jgi:hypothetical protein
MTAVLHIRPTTRAEAVQRALAWVAKGAYQLGAGASVEAESPFDAAGNPHPGHADCSGFTAWCTGHARKQRIAGQGVLELNTDGVIADARGRQLVYALVRRTEPVLAGDLIVYGGVYDLDDDPDRDRPGHIGIITEVEPDFVRGSEAWWDDLIVVHCGAHRPGRSAVRRTDATAWRQRGFIVRPRHYQGEGE